MPEFYYQASFEESIAMLSDVLARCAVRLLHCAKEHRTYSAFPTPNPEEHERISGDLEVRLRAQHEVMLVGSFTHRPLDMVEVGPNLPGCYRCGPSMMKMDFRLADAIPQGVADAHLRAPDSDLAVENAFDDIVTTLKAHLVRVTRHGSRFWVSPKVRDWMEANPSYRQVFYGVLPRRRVPRVGPWQISHHSGVLRFERGERPAAEVRYHKHGIRMTLSTGPDAPEDHYTELFEVCAGIARAEGLRLAPADERSTEILDEEKRFERLRAPDAPAVTEREVDVPLDLARFCRELLLFGEEERAASTAQATVRDGVATIAYFPEGRCRRYGFESILRWSLTLTREELVAVGRREKPRIAVQEYRWEPSEVAQVFEIERALTPPSIDGAIHGDRIGHPHRHRALVLALVPYFVEMTSATSVEGRARAIGHTVDAIEAHPQVLFVRRDEVEAALLADPLPPDASPRIAPRTGIFAATKLVEAVAHALETRAAQLTIAVRDDPDGPWLARDPSGRFFHEFAAYVLPFLRDPARPVAGGVEVRISFREGAVSAWLPRRAFETETLQQLWRLFA